VGRFHEERRLAFTYRPILFTFIGICSDATCPLGHKVCERLRRGRSSLRLPDHMFDVLIILFAAHLLAVASPGPSNGAIMATAMDQGRRAGLVLSLGVTAGSFTWGCLAAAGVSAAIAAQPGALHAIRLAGGFYLLFLAIRALRSAWQSETASSRPSQPPSGTRIFFRGYLMHITNPKAILSWMSIIAIGLSADGGTMLVPAILAGCLMISLVCNAAYALVFSSGPAAAAYRRCRRPLEAAFACLFGYAGTRLLMQS
jgi:threonine efflux protein